MWYAIGAILLTAASVGAVRVYQNQKLKRTNPKAYAKLQALKKKRKQQRKANRKKMKENVQKMSKIPTAVVNAGVKATNEINNTITPFLYGTTQENKNTRSR